MIENQAWEVEGFNNLHINYSNISSSLATKELESFLASGSIEDESETFKHWLSKSQEIIDTLTSVGVLLGNETIHRLARKLLVCSEFEYEASDLLNQSGELFDGQIRLCPCKSQFCYFCQKIYCAERREKARSFVQCANSRIDELSERFSIKRNAKVCLFWQFITPAMPKVEGKSIVVAKRVYIRAFDLLKKKSFWTKCVVGGVRTLEFFSKAHITFLNSHLLVLADFTGCYETLEKAWRECISKAWEQQGIRLNLPDENLIHSSILESRQIDFVIRYIIKPQPFHKLDPINMVALTSEKRLRRIEISPIPKLDLSYLSISPLNSEPRPNIKPKYHGRSKALNNPITSNMTPDQYEAYLRAKTKQREYLVKDILSRRQPYARFRNRNETFYGTNAKEASNETIH